MATNGLTVRDPNTIQDDGVPNFHRALSSPSPPIPAFARGQTPLWNTLESMLHLRDLSDTDDDTKDNNLPILYDDDSLDPNDEALNVNQMNTKLTSPSQIAFTQSTPPTSDDSKLPSHLDIDSDKVLSRPKLSNSVSVPIRQMQYHEIDTITIWSNHKQELHNLLHKRTDKKNIKFQDTENKTQSDDSCTKAAKKDMRRCLMREIIKTEESYVKGLNTLLYEFVIPMFDQKMIDLKHKETITCNIPEILMFHTAFLKQLVDAIADEKKETLVAVFHTLCNDEFVGMYTKYAKTYQNMLDVYAKYKFHKSNKLQKYLKAQRTEKKPLTNHLILPIQRVTRYLLLLQELKRKTPVTHSDYKDLECVLRKINETVNQINEKQRVIECMSQCLQVQENMIGLHRNIVEPHRKLLAQFLFRKKENQRARQFFLFNDLLIITNVKFKVKALIEVRTIDIKREEESKVEFRLYSLDHEAVYETDQDKAEDLDTLFGLIEYNRSIIHQQSLRSVGADDMASLLDVSSHSVYNAVSGSSLKMHIDADGYHD